MKFVESILSNNTTDDHCQEFVAQRGLRPLVTILGLPNLPVDFPTSAACQAVAGVCKSILVPRLPPRAPGAQRPRPRPRCPPPSAIRQAERGVSRLRLALSGPEFAFSTSNFHFLEGISDFPPQIPIV